MDSQRLWPLLGSPEEEGVRKAVKKASASGIATLAGVEMIRLCMAYGVGKTTTFCVILDL